MRQNPTYMALLGPTRLFISEKSVTYTIIWQVRVVLLALNQSLIITRKFQSGQSYSYIMKKVWYHQI